MNRFLFNYIKMAYKIENDFWVWNSEPIMTKAVTLCEKSPNLYMNTPGNISILYYNIYDIPKSSTDLFKLNRNELICFFNMFGLSLIQNYLESSDKEIKEQLCDICGNVSRFRNNQLFMNNIYLHICPLCLEVKGAFNYEVIRFHVNTRPGLSHTIKDLIEKKIDVTFVSDTKKLVYLWRSTYKIERFLYKNIIYEKWYNRSDSIKQCEWCGRHENILIPCVNTVTIFHLIKHMKTFINLY